MNTSIGFRIKFRKEQYEELEEIIKEYSYLFERYEIKVTKFLTEADNIRNIISLSKKYLTNGFSLHLPKNILEDERELKKCESLFNVLQEMQYKGNLITHIPADINFEKYGSVLKKISKMIPSNSILLLENIVTESNIEYLSKINTIFYMLNKLNIDNIKCCLDLGHLFFGFYKEHKAQKEAIRQLSKCKNILGNIKEIHLHDFNESLDHLQLGEGLLDLSLIYKFILENEIICPIIIEVTVINSNDDGYKQIEIARQTLSGKKETLNGY